MKQLYFIPIFLQISFILSAQNVGIGVPAPLQKLEVDGAVKIGTTTTNQPGAIRYNAGKFEGGDGSNWKSLEGLPSKAIILAQSQDTVNIKAAGFSVLRVIDLWDTAFIPVSTNFPGSWANGFPLTSTLINPASNASNESVLYNNKFIYYGTDSYLYLYDIILQKWDRSPTVSPLGARLSCGVTQVGNDIYITGGYSFVNSPPSYIISNTAAKYNLITNTWASIANMPVTSTSHATAAIGTDIYLLNGASTVVNSFNFNFTKKMYRYNTLTNIWSADISSASTPGPEYLNNGQLISRNNKLVWTNARLLAIEYDPVTHVNTNISYNIPGGSGFSVESYSMALAGNKLYITGEKSFGNVTSPPPPLKPEIVHFELELSNTTTVPLQLNVCKIQNSKIFCYKYNPSSDRFYGLNILNQTKIFNRSGTETCDQIMVLKGYWSYMKKN